MPLEKKPEVSPAELTNKLSEKRTELARLEKWAALEEHWGAFKEYAENIIQQQENGLMDFDRIPIEKFPVTVAVSLERWRTFRHLRDLPQNAKKAIENVAAEISQLQSDLRSVEKPKPGAVKPKIV